MPSSGQLRVPLAIGGLLAGIVASGLGAAILSLVLLGTPDQSSGCEGGGGAASIALGPPGSGEVVGATEYGGPGDPRSGVQGAHGDNLLEHPDSYAELGGLTWNTATAMGGLPYMTALRITWGRRSALAYKRDFGLGGGPVDGHPRVIDLWWQLAGRLGIPYQVGQWSGPVRIERPPDTGAGNLLAPAGATPAFPARPDPGAPAPWAPDPGAPVPGAPDGGAPGSAAGDSSCAPDAAGVPVTTGLRARLLAGGIAAAPAGAPLAVQEMIAAGNQIEGKPYVYGAAHGAPLSEVEPAYDCSSSVEHLLYGARLLPVTYGEASSALESFGRPGPGRWVTLYANADHVFMYVAGLRWDTHGAAGSGDGSPGIGWHPLVRSSAGFIPRHPVGL